MIVSELISKLQELNLPDATVMTTDSESGYDEAYALHLIDAERIGPLLEVYGVKNPNCKVVVIE